MKNNKTTLGQRECNACGDAELFSSMKQEKEYMDNHIDASIRLGKATEICFYQQIIDNLER